MKNLNKKALASVKRGLAQASRGEGKPLPFDLKEDETWLNDDGENEDEVSTPIATRNARKRSPKQKDAK